MKEEIKKIYDQLNTIDNMLTSLVELLEERGMLTQEEWEKRIREKEEEDKGLVKFEDLEEREKDEGGCMRLYVVGKLPREDVDGVWEEGVFVILDNEHQVSLPDVEFERVYLPVVCKSCGAPNILVGEDIEAVSGTEREMGEEVIHSDRVYGKCVNCGKPMEARVDIYEYPSYSFQHFEVDEEDNCKCQDIGNLNLLIDDIVWAQKYRERKDF